MSANPGLIRPRHAARGASESALPLPRRPRISLMDTTLRDGEQTPDLAFSSEEKLRIARMSLCDVGVDRVEVCSARVSAGERRAAELIASWAAGAGQLHRIEALGFCDGGRSVDWIRATGIMRMNLLVKGSERHCQLQLGLSLAQHCQQIAHSLEAASRAELEISGVYLEDWSRGISHSPGYVLELTKSLEELGVRRVYLADTLGVLVPAQVQKHVKRMRQQFPALSFEFHAHDDYGLATANCLAAARAGVDGLHTTVNGLGERAGNARLAEVAVVLRDHTRRVTYVDETRLLELSELVAQASGCRVAHHAPIVGRHAFTQTAGIHADGDAKAALYCSALAPERFARRRAYALGKLSGRASIEHHLRALGIQLSPAAQARLLERVVALGDAKRAVCREDLAALAQEDELPTQSEAAGGSEKGSSPLAAALQKTPDI
jgi:(R)-citramalate synthase